MGNDHRPYDDEGRPTCPKCGGDLEYAYDEKTCANERRCKDCGYAILDGFGVIA